MKLRRWVMAAGLTVLLPFTSGCPADKSQGAGPNPGQGGQGYGDPNPGQQAPVPNADPGPQNEPGHALLIVIWVGERSGKVEFTVNSGEAVPKPCPKPSKDKDGKYRGRCEWAVATQPGLTIGFTWFPDVPGMFAQCVLYASGLQQDYQHVQTGPCAVSWKVS